MNASAAIWHEVECGGYTADLALWGRLAEEFPGPVLDVGAGTGRVGLELARGGANVVALESNRELAADLEGKAQEAEGGRLAVVCADAREFVDEQAFALVVVAMQTVQLFGGASGRARFFECARRNVSAGGCLAVAVADIAQGAGGGQGAFEPDVLVRGGQRYSSRPVSMRCDGDEVVIERERIQTAGGNEVARSLESQAIDRVEAKTIVAEGEAAGLKPGAVEYVPETEAYAGSEVVLLHG